MKELTLIIPAKFEAESLPIFLDELNKYDCKKIIVLDNEDLVTPKAILGYKNINILVQKKKWIRKCIN